MERPSGTSFAAVGRGVALAAVLAAVAGCANDGPSSATPPASVPAMASAVETETGTEVDADAAAAEQICTALKDQANVLTRVANDAVRSINTLSPQQRVTAITDGFDAAATAVAEFADGLAGLEVVAIDERDAILLEIAAGADAALEELADERVRFSAEAGDAISDEQVQGSVGQFFNSIEKVNSLVEPVIVRYDRVEMQRAFLAAEPCEHVIQPFRIDE